MGPFARVIVEKLATSELQWIRGRDWAALGKSLSPSSFHFLFCRTRDLDKGFSKLVPQAQLSSGWGRGWGPQGLQKDSSAFVLFSLWGFCFSVLHLGLLPKKLKIKSWRVSLLYKKV